MSAFLSSILPLHGSTLLLAAGAAGGLALACRRRGRPRDIDLADAASEGLIRCDDGRIIACNSAFRTLTGHPPGTPMSAVFSPAALEVLRSAVGTMQEVFVRHQDGSQIAVQAALNTFADGAEGIALRDVRATRAAQDEKDRIIRARLEAEQRFRLLVQSVTDYAIYMLDPDGHVANWNAGAQRNKGYTAEEIVGQHFSLFFSAEDRAAGLPARLLDRARSTGKVEAEGWRHRKDGSRFWASVLLEPIFDDEGVHVGFAKITHDNTRQRQAALDIRNVQTKLRLALENMSQGIALFDEGENLVLFNARLMDLVGLTDTGRLTLDDLASALAARIDLSSSSLDDLYTRHRDLWRGSKGGEMLLDLSDGRTVMVVHSPVAEGGWVTTLEDVSERTRSERQIVHMARHDGLTGLPNRASYAEHMEWVLDEAREDDTLRVAIHGIDLDRFKEINDHMGHAVGDQVLTVLARRLEGLLEEGEFVARIGGDEFAAYKTYKDVERLQEFQSRIRRAICAPIRLGDNEVAVGASIGFAIFPGDGQHYEKLMANADMAMYRAKTQVTDKTCRYEPFMDEASRDRQSMARDLWGAIAREEMHLHHQIQKSVSTGATTGYEVLLRWTHPERGPVSPAEFIPIAEECGAILPIGEWVLRTACRQAAIWSEDIRIAVNLSPVQMNNANFVDQLRNILAETGLAPWRLELEVTESVIITDKDRALRTLNQIKALGVTVAIDDFGTGYSSLDTLRSFPFDKIKLDRSFIREVETNLQSKAIIRAILALGRSLEVPVLAEGVETPAQLSLLRTEGCDEAQGYFLGRPGVLTMPTRSGTGMVA